MVKKCIICGKEAEYCVKNCSDYYCDDCAEEQFGDVGCLLKVEEEARKLKNFLKEREIEQEKPPEEGNGI